MANRRGVRILSQKEMEDELLRSSSSFWKGEPVIHDVHCLECNDVFQEEEGQFVSVCPSCGNDDTTRTVYETPKEEKELYGEI